MASSRGPVGVFDSGVGGISVLRTARVLLPGEDYLYYGDTGHAPYGTKPPQEVLGYATAVAEHLLDQGAKAILIACNTATSVAAQTLRANLKVPVIGMEPALKPAALLRQGGKILVLATPVTLRLPKFQRLMEQYGQDAIPVPCPGLMEFVERGEWEGENLRGHLKGLLSPFKDLPVDAVVLGCTHYIFLRQMIKSLLPPKTAVLDGNVGTVRQLRHRLEEEGLLNPREAGGQVLLETSGDPGIMLPRMETLLNLPLNEFDAPHAALT